MNSICIYCGSSDKIRPEYLAAARQMGQAVARRGWTLWYGAGSTGLMGAVAQAALDAGGQVVGVIPEMFNTPQLCHTGLTRLEVTATMHVRKARLAEAADAFVALPGGYGTFEEFFEIITWAQIGLHAKPVGLLNTLDYYAPLLALVARARSEGFIYAEHQALFQAAGEPETLLDQLAAYQPPAGLERWVTRPEE